MLLLFWRVYPAIIHDLPHFLKLYWKRIHSTWDSDCWIQWHSHEKTWSCHQEMPNNWERQANIKDQMQQSPFNKGSASLWIPSSWNQKVKKCVHKSLPLIHILSQINPTDMLPFYFCKIHFNISISPTHRFSKWYLSLRFSYQIFLSHVCQMPHPCQNESFIRAWKKWVK